MGGSESAGVRRENLEQAAYAEIGDDGGSHQRADAKGATDLWIDARIVFHVFARDQESAASALSGETLFCVDGGSEGRSRIAGLGAADHFFIGRRRRSEKRQSGAAGSGESQGALRDELENCVDIASDLGHFGTNWFHRLRRGWLLGRRG